MSLGSAIVKTRRTIGTVSAIFHPRRHILSYEKDGFDDSGYYHNGLEPEKYLYRASPETKEYYLSQIYNAASSLTSAITSALHSIVFPHFVVPAVINLGFLGHYSIKIHTIRKWAKVEGVKLARRREVLARILSAIIIKLAASLLTANYSDFAFLMHAIMPTSDSLAPGQMVGFLNAAQNFSSNRLVEGINVVTGAPLNAAQDSLGIAGQEVLWTNHMSASNFLELGLANETGEIIATDILEKPIEKMEDLIRNPHKSSLFGKLRETPFSQGSAKPRYEGEKSQLSIQPPSSSFISDKKRSTPRRRPSKPTQLSSKSSFASPLLKGDLPSYIDISNLSLNRLQTYTKLYAGPRARKARTRMIQLEKQMKKNRNVKRAAVFSGMGVIGIGACFVGGPVLGAVVAGVGWGVGWFFS